MIEVALSEWCICKLREELRTAGSNEIGGVLAAEQVGDGRFLVVDLSVQRNGTQSQFSRDPVQHREFIQQFHERMGQIPERFNYLGEWHSHPAYAATPSDVDFCQMQSLVEDKEQQSSFLVLMTIKLDQADELRGSVYGFRPGSFPVRGQLRSIDGESVHEELKPTILIIKDF